jgi:hypothetical protein
MRYLMQLLIILALIPMDAYSAPSKAPAKAPSTVKVQGKVVKQTTVRDNKGKKQSCQVVVDNKTKKKYTVCHP